MANTVSAIPFKVKGPELWDSHILNNITVRYVDGDTSISPKNVSYAQFQDIALKETAHTFEIFRDAKWYPINEAIHTQLDEYEIKIGKYAPMKE